jgi:hypothetical protein
MADRILDRDELREDAVIAPPNSGAGAGACDGDGNGDGGDGASTAVGSSLALAPRSLPAVVRISEEEAASGTFGIEDVLLPVPGFLVTYPSHAVGAATVAQLMSDAGALPATETVGSLGRAAAAATPAPVTAPAQADSAAARVAAAFTPRDARFQFTGDYRALVSTARDMQWTVLHVEPHRDVIGSDADVLRGRRPVSAGSAQDTPAMSVVPAAPVALDAPAAPAAPSAPTALAALQLSFTLSRSAYATVALREVMRSLNH